MGAGELSIVIRRIHSIAPEQARDTRARAWDFVFECWKANKEGGPAAAPDEGERNSDEAASTKNSIK
jgi:hypothetical protein